MEALREAVWTVFCGALLCALVAQIGGTGQGHEMRKMLCGVFLAAIILSSLGALDLSDAYREMKGYSLDAAAAVKEGAEQAQQMKFSIISDQCEAYILDKAAELGAQIGVTVSLDPETGFPCAAVITGTLTPWEKQTLSSEITNGLGIKKEALDWNT